MFWADNFTDAEYVGFVDTDTFFVSPVDREDLFEDGKPVVIGFFGKENSWWRNVPKSTNWTLGQNEVMRCMSYFPVIIKVQHLRALREFIFKTHGMHMNDYFLSLIRTFKSVYSQFSIMCNFLWYHYRDEYAWYVQELHPGTFSNSPGQVRSIQEAGIIPDMLKVPGCSSWTYHAYSSR